MIKKNSNQSIIAIVALVLLAAVLVYFYISVNRLEALALDVQGRNIENSNLISAVVNFLNSSLNVQ